MSTFAYNCPCCGAPLAYDAANKNLKCASCGNSYELEALEAMNQEEQTGGVQFDLPKETFDASETGLFGIVTGEPPAGMNTWWVIAAVVCIPSLLVVVAGLFDRAKKKKKSKS